MTLLEPAALWWLALGVPVVLLHLYRARRRQIEVASTRLWREFGGGRAGRTGFARPNELLTLLLLLLAIASFSVALARPVRGAGTADGAGPNAGRSLVVVIDASATLLTRDVDGARRFDAARAAARRVIGDAVLGDDVTVWLASEGPLALVAPTRHLDAAAAALADGGAGAAPTLAPRCLVETVAAARHALRLRRVAGHVIVFTDPPGADSLAEATLEKVGADAAHSATLHVVVVGEPTTQNAGIVDVEPGPLGRIAVRVSATDGAVAGRRIVARAGGQEIGAAPVALAAGASDWFLVDPGPVGAAVAPLITLRLEPGDAFAEDDHAAASRPHAVPLRVIVTAPGGRVSPFLRSAIEAQDARLVDHAAALVAATDAPMALLAAADVVIAEGAEPPALPQDRPLLAFVEEGEPALRPLLWGVGAHPVLDGVDLAPLRIDRAGVMELRPTETAIVETTSGAVGVADDGGSARRVRFRFRPAASTLPLEAAFPLLVRNALSWLRPRQPPGGAVRAGATVPLRDHDLGAGTQVVVLAVWQRRETHPATPSSPEPAAPVPAPDSDRVLRLLGADGALLGELGLVWSLPVGVRVGSDRSAPDVAQSLAALPPPAPAAPPREEYAGALAVAAAVFLAAGAVLLAIAAPTRSAAGHSAPGGSAPGSLRAQ